MKIAFTEPKAPRYIYINPNTNKIHLLMPIVSGSQIGLDNTCKSVYSLQEFFGRSMNKHQKTAFDELTLYQKALEFDLGLIAEDSELKTKKQERLRQINTYIDRIETLLQTDVLDGLNEAFPIYPAALEAIMKLSDTNLYSMVLRPGVMDLYLRSVNPVFSINRTDRSAFFEALTDVYYAMAPVKDAKTRLSDSVLDALELAGQKVTFTIIQQVLTDKTFGDLGVNVDYYRKSSGELITRAEIMNMMALTGNSSAQSYVDALLGLCAPNLFDMLVESPFYAVKTAEELVLVTQFFIASVNIYCRAHSLSTANFGADLDDSSELSILVAKQIVSSIANNRNVEEDLLVHLGLLFNLNKPLSPVDRAQIKQRFSADFAQIKESPHFDEFTLLYDVKPGPFISHQNCICVDFCEFSHTALPNATPDIIAADRAAFKALKGSVTHSNPWIHAEIEIDIDELLGKITNEEQLHNVLKQLSPEQQQPIIASPIWQKLQLSKFLHHIAKGQQDKAEELLKTNPNAQLILQSETFTDYSGRTFTCSAYEYAYWAKDKHMCRMLEQHMDEETKAEIFKRCETIESVGLTYIQHDIVVTGSKHFDLNSLKVALQKYIQIYDIDYVIGPAYIHETKTAWLEVGKAQRDVPAHIAQEYCQNLRGLYLDSLSRQLSFVDPETQQETCWFPLRTNSSGLGFEFAFYRGGSSRGTANEDAIIDLNAITCLDEVRTADLIQSRANLQPKEPVLAMGVASLG